MPEDVPIIFFAEDIRGVGTSLDLRIFQSFFATC